MGILYAILILLVVLTLEERLRPDAPHLMRLAVIAVSVCSALCLTSNIGDFLGYEVLAATKDMSAFRVSLFLSELLGCASVHTLGWGFLLIGWAAVRSRRLPRILCYIIFILGIVSIIEFTFIVGDFIPGLIIFALLWLIVFVWLGIVFLRKSV
jgi:hypothetical protein